MSIVGSHRLFAAALLLVAAGCGGKHEMHGKRAAVRGAVLIDGKPLERATIAFVPADGEKTVVATASVQEGFYEIPSERGPLVGRMRVEIRSQTLDLEQFEAERGGDLNKRVESRLINIPKKYNEQSTLIADVSEDETRNKFDFRLSTE